jgi:itaconate CoA-transferase
MESYYAEYKKKTKTALDAVSLIRNGSTIVVGVNYSEPPALLDALAQKVRAGELKYLNTYSFNPQKYAAQTIFAPDLADCIRPNAWFISPPVRNVIRVGLAYYVPSYLYQVPRLMRDNMNVDVTITTVSPMDKAGYFSFGAASYISVASRLSKKVIVEVNENMPRVFGDALIHISEVDAVTENHVPLLESVMPESSPEDKKIGAHIAAMIPDGACLQLGIGVVPNAVAESLADHRDLGIHSELLVPGMVDLIKKGVINGSRKTFHPRKHLFSVAYGTREVFDFMNDNPSMESYPSDYVMEPGNIAKNHNMVSVNSILEVDLTGQCNAETLDGFQFSGTGGQLDFVRGAYSAPGGMSILAFYATAKKGEVSRVIPRLGPGAGVTTPRMDTQYLATEFGIVNLKGKSTRDRALDIISIAHPKFRDDLLREADSMRLI